MAVLVRFPAACRHRGPAKGARHKNRRRRPSRHGEIPNARGPHTRHRSVFVFVFVVVIEMDADYDHDDHERDHAPSIPIDR